MLALLICVAKDTVIMISLPHVIDWGHGVEGTQAVTTKDRARGGARTLSQASKSALSASNFVLIPRTMHVMTTLNNSNLAPPAHSREVYICMGPSVQVIKYMMATQ